MCTPLLICFVQLKRLLGTQYCSVTGGMKGPVSHFLKPDGRNSLHSSCGSSVNPKWVSWIFFSGEIKIFKDQFETLRKPRSGCRIGKRAEERLTAGPTLIYWSLDLGGQDWNWTQTKLQSEHRTKKRGCVEMRIKHEISTSPGRFKLPKKMYAI